MIQQTVFGLGIFTKEARAVSLSRSARERRSRSDNYSMISDSFARNTLREACSAVHDSLEFDEAVDRAVANPDEGSITRRLHALFRVGLLPRRARASGASDDRCARWRNRTGACSTARTMRTIATRGTSFDAIVTIHERAYFFDLASARLDELEKTTSRDFARAVRSTASGTPRRLDAPRRASNNIERDTFHCTDASTFASRVRARRYRRERRRISGARARWELSTRISREMTSMARACANGRPSGQKNDFVGRVRARSGRWTSRGRPVRSDPTMDRVASAGTSSGRGARTAWRTLHAISPASQGTHETEDDSGSESEEDEDLKGVQEERFSCVRTGKREWRRQTGRTTAESVGVGSARWVISINKTGKSGRRPA